MRRHTGVPRRAAKLVKLKPAVESGINPPESHELSKNSAARQVSGRVYANPTPPQHRGSHLKSSLLEYCWPRRRLVALLDTIACADHISRGHVVRRALVSEVEQHIRRALRTLASPTTPAEQEEIDGFCKVLGLGDDWNYTPR